MNNAKPPILLTEALEDLEKKQPCSIVYRSCDVNRKKGGELVTLNNVVLHGSDWKNATRTVKPADDQHGDDLKSFHIRLLIWYNGRRVIW